MCLDCITGLCCSTRSIQTLITVCRVSFHLLLPEFDISKLRLHLIHWSLKYAGVEHPNVQGVSCWPRLECRMAFPTLCLTPEHRMDKRMQWTVGCFPELCFHQFTEAQVLVGLRKQLTNNFVFPTLACATGFNYINNNNNNNKTEHPFPVYTYNINLKLPSP